MDVPVPAVALAKLLVKDLVLAVVEPAALVVVARTAMEHA